MNTEPLQKGFGVLDVGEQVGALLEPPPVSVEAVAELLPP
jgi:hypothetical protein